MIEAISNDDLPVIGALLLATDMTTERDVRALVPGPVPVCATRVAFENPTTPDNLVRTLPHLRAAASLIVPGVPLAALYFSCTSASAALGEDRVAAAIGAARPGVPVVTPIGAARRALWTLGARKLAIMTPYVQSTATLIVEHLSGIGFDITSTYGMNMEDDYAMAALPAQPIIEAARAAMAPDAEALFISCTALPAAQLVPVLEAELGVPVVTSNLAGLWMAMRVAGLSHLAPEHGRLMAKPFVAEAA